MKISKVHVVFKTHLDIGFTDLAESVVSHYLNHYIPAALRCADAVNRPGEPPLFLWTVGSYLIDLALRAYPREQRDALDAAIRKGYITYHALPFTTHSELCDDALFRAGLGVAKRLDKRYGRQTIAAKMTDVPGHTMGIIAPLFESGVKYLHIGINSVACMPKVPPLFVWENDNGQSMIVNYCRSYGGVTEVKGHDEVLYFMHSQDNMGPPSVEHLKAEFVKLSEMFPGAEICASTLNAYAQGLARIQHTLPVVKGEIGDTWIHGAGTDPKKVSALRALTRLAAKWDREGVWEKYSSALPDGRSPREAFLEELLLICEHTWGLDTKKYLADFKNWSRAGFDKARERDLLADEYGNVPGCENYYAFAKAEFHHMHPAHINWETRSYSFFESSHEEQRKYLYNAAELLPVPLREQALRLISSPEEDTPAPDAVGPQAQTNQAQFASLCVCVTPDGELNVSASGKENAAVKISPAVYQEVGLCAYRKLGEDFLENLEEFRDWAMPDNFKPGLESSDAPEKSILHAPAFGETAALQNGVLHMRGTYPSGPQETAGCPAEIRTRLWSPEEGKLLLEAKLLRKPANRKPESIFVPVKLPAGAKVELQKIGTWICLENTIPAGNERCHAVQRIRLTLENGDVWILEPLDTPLLAIGAPELIDFSRPETWDTLYLALYDNLWGTNFKMWYGEDILFRLGLTYEGRKAQ